MRLALLLFGTLAPSFLLAPSARAQDARPGRGLDDFRGSVSVTNKGISTIPNLTLGRPAAFFDMAARMSGVSFQPEFRVSLDDGQPWAFIFRWRYDLVEAGRFRLVVGAHPAVSFRPFYTVQEGVEREVNEARRFAAAELLPSLALAPGLSLDAYYLYSHGFEASVPDNTHYLSVGLGLPATGPMGGVALGVRPQLYYLNIDASDGVYTTLNASLSKRGLPLAITSIITAPIQTDIPGSPDLLWNVSLVYSFDLID